MMMPHSHTVASQQTEACLQFAGHPSSEVAKLLSKRKMEELDVRARMRLGPGLARHSRHSQHTSSGRTLPKPAPTRRIVRIVSSFMGYCTVLYNVLNLLLPQL